LERFYSSVPGLNPFIAQIIINRLGISVAELIDLSIDQATQIMPDVNRKQLVRRFQITTKVEL
jgi:hypothetical protein